MRSWIGLRITTDVEGDGPAVLRRVLTELVAMMDRGDVDVATIPAKVMLGATVVEIGAGPAPQDGSAPAHVAPNAPTPPEPVQAAVEVPIHERQEP